MISKQAFVPAFFMSKNLPMNRDIIPIKKILKLLQAEY